MDLVEFILKRFCESMDAFNLFGFSSAKFLYFETEDGVRISEGLNSGVLFGKIMIEIEGEQVLSPSVVLKVVPDYKPFPEFHMFCFTNEIFFHSQVLPFFSSMKSIDHLFPKFYTSQLITSLTSMDGVIMFEDLHVDGYKHTIKKSFLDYEHLALMARSLGEYHSYSYAAKTNSNDEVKRNFNAMAGSFTDIFFSVLGKLSFLLPKVTLRGLKYLDEDIKYKHRVTDLEKLFQRANEHSAEIIKDRNNPLAVLCHGDFFRSNLLFKYDDEKPTHIKFIDMANSCLASPVIDLTIILYLHSDQEMRNNHWNDLIDNYYFGLRSTFPDSDIPTKEKILDEFNDRALYAYYIASFYLPLLIATDNDLPCAELRPPEWREKYQYSLFPEKIYIDFLNNVGESIATKALGEILKDMIDRKFV